MDSPENQKLALNRLAIVIAKAKKAHQASQNKFLKNKKIINTQEDILRSLTNLGDAILVAMKTDPTAAWQEFTLPNHAEDVTIYHERRQRLAAAESTWATLENRLAERDSTKFTLFALKELLGLKDTTPTAEPIKGPRKPVPILLTEDPLRTGLTAKETEQVKALIQATENAMRDCSDSNPETNRVAVQNAEEALHHFMKTLEPKYEQKFTRLKRALRVHLAELTPEEKNELATALENLKRAKHQFETAKNLLLITEKYWKLMFIQNMGDLNIDFPNLTPEESHAVYTALRNLKTAPTTLVPDKTLHRLIDIHLMLQNPTQNTVAPESPQSNFTPEKSPEVDTAPNTPNKTPAVHDRGPEPYLTLEQPSADSPQPINPENLITTTPTVGDEKKDRTKQPLASVDNNIGPATDTPIELRVL